MNMFFHEKRWESRRFAACTMTLLLVLSVLFCAAYAAERDTQAICLTAADDWSGQALTGAQITLAEKMDDSYQNIPGKTEISVPQSGLELELPLGEYRLTVDETPENYLTSGQPIEFRVTGDGVEILSAKNSEVTGMENGASLLTIYFALNYNDFMVSLPATGGMGTTPCILGGLLLMAAAVLGGIVLRRSRVRGA